MDIFVDTEFTGLTGIPELISLGAVSEDGQEFYQELPIIGSCTEFVLAHVLPLLSGGYALAHPAEFRSNFAGWIAALGPGCVLLTGDPLDRQALRRFFEGSTGHHPGPLSITPDCQVPMLELPPLGLEASHAFDQAQQAYFAGDPRQHHALADARALRLGMLAARAAGKR